MSGHSKWSQIKHKKGVADQKKGQVFSKLSKLISIAARKGIHPDKNIELKNAIEKARSLNMPKESIERSLKRVAEKDSARLEELLVEAIGPESVNIIITAVTDNKNRTIGAIKNILSKYEAKMAQSGSVMWAFEKNGLFEELAGNEDVQEVYTNIGD
ncbi:MAG: YebC/PmpR family DNA-binding transcriptional regulator [Candidatus Yanofskybacteria bacterium]|nr:YebC/PmpR family DNA-binding transcriptional regulator [Candidatus Yanofskybacteria bacterium]